MDVGLLATPGTRCASRRASASATPRGGSTCILTDRTTDYHAHLMEFDIPDTKVAHHQHDDPRLPCRRGDTLFGHLALMDWGRERYRVDLDYLQVDIVEVDRAGPDQGAAVPYHPPVADPKSFRRLAVAQDGMIDLENTGRT